MKVNKMSMKDDKVSVQGLASVRDVRSLEDRLASLEAQIDEHCSYLQHVHDMIARQAETNGELRDRIKCSLQKVRDLQELEEHTDAKVSGVLVKVMRQVGTVQRDLILAVEQAEMNHERIEHIHGMCNEMAMESHMRDIQSTAMSAFPKIKHKKDDAS